MNRVFIISPYRGDLINNVAYAHAAIKDCFRRGEAPYASHIMNTDALNDDIPEERELGMRAGWVWLRECHHVAVYEDFGVTDGMLDDIDAANKIGLRIHRRSVAFRSHSQNTLDLLKACAEAFDTTIDEMCRPGQGKSDWRRSSAREAFCFILREKRLRRNEIADLLNMSDPGVSSAIARARYKIQNNPMFCSTVERLKK